MPYFLGIVGGPSETVVVLVVMVIVAVVVWV